MKHMMGFYLSLTALSACAAIADVTLTSARSALRISNKAVPLSLVLTADGTECLNRAHRDPIAQIQTSDGAWHPASALSREGDALVLGFEGVDTTLTLAADTSHEWIGLRLTSISGKRPQAVDFVRLDSAFTEIVGKRLNIGWNNSHALCVMAASPVTETRAAGQTRVTLAETVAAVGRGEAGVNPRVCLTASTPAAKGPRMEGSAAAIIACPTADFKRIAREVAHAYGLPANESPDGGIPAKEAARARESYLFTSAGLAAADKLIRICNEAGLRQVMLSPAAWLAPDGFFEINRTNFPNGPQDLKTFVRRLNADGITVGLSVPASSVKAAPQPARLAEVYNTCGFGMICFCGGDAAIADGSDFSLAQFQEQTLRQLNPPAVCMGDVLSHGLWHALARSPAMGEGASFKPQVDASVNRLLSLRDDMMPGVIGGRDPNGCSAATLQLDELEYLLCRSVAFDAPVSFRADLDALAQNPLAPDILRLFRLYETARLANRFSEADKAPMREPGKEFTMVLRKTFPPVLVPVHSVNVGGSSNTHATVGAFEGGSVATFWNATGNADVTLDLSPFVARVADFEDRRVVVKKSANEKLMLPVSTQRLTLFCPTVPPSELEQKIKNSLCTGASRSL